VGGTGRDEIIIAGAGMAAHLAGVTAAHTTLPVLGVPLPGADKDQTAGEVGESRDRALLNLGYEYGKFSGVWSTTYIGSANLDDQFLLAYVLPVGSVGVGTVIYHDFQVNFSPNEKYNLYVGVNNVLDKEPPPLISGLPSDVTGAETDSGTYDAIGRRWYAGFRVKL